MWANPPIGFPLGFPLFPAIPVLGLLLLIGVGFWMMRANKFGRRWSRFDPAEVLLRERYARGEIDAEEYRSRKDELDH